MNLNEGMAEGMAASAVDTEKETAKGIKHSCEYSNSHRLKIGDDYRMQIEAANPKEAYEKFIGKVGVYPQRVSVHSSKFDFEEFDDHINTDEKILNELRGLRSTVNDVEDRLTNLKWVIFTSAIAILVTLKFGGVVLK